jgi:hypothetical protein
LFPYHAGSWQTIAKNYLFPVKVLSTVFRAKMLQALRERQVDVPQSELLLQKPWSVFSKACLCKPETVLRYLGRYTRKGMLHESRLQQVDETTVSFSYRDYQDENKRKIMTLQGDEFIRRYLSHLLPRSQEKVKRRTAA